MARPLALLLLIGCGRIDARSVDDAAGPSDAGDALDAGNVVDAANVVDAGIDAPTIEGLVAWYPMDVLDGGRVGDMTGHHHGTCIGSACPTLITAGRIGGAYEFDGGDDIVHVPSSPELALTNGFTLTAWIKHVETTGCFISKAFGAQSDAWQGCMEGLTDGRPGHLVLLLSGNETTEYPLEYVYSRNAFASEDWLHVALWRNGTTERIYVNGVIQQEMTGIAMAVDDARFQIGSGIAAGLPRLRFAGLIDDVRIYNRALEDSEILELLRVSP